MRCLRFEQEDLTEQVETPSDDGVSPGVPIADRLRKML
jgi:hypothetical protein